MSSTINQDYSSNVRTPDLSAPVVMGVLNVTPDSFSDGGRFVGLDAALAHCETMVLEGAGVIDVGGESTRPGASPVSVQQELERVVPVVEAIRKHFDVAISVDTSTPEVMISAAAAGADIINDVRALRRDGALEAASASGLTVCLMHMQGEPDTMQQRPVYDHVVDEVFAFLQERVRACEQAGMKRERIWIDPGYGFGKTVEHNLQLLQQQERLLALQLPMLVGWSRKSTIGKVLDREVDQRLPGSLAAAVLAVQAGARIVRAHDVQATLDAVRMAWAVMQSGRTQADRGCETVS